MKTPLSTSGNVIRTGVLLLALVCAQTLPAQVQLRRSSSNGADTNVILVEAWTNQVTARSSNAVIAARYIPLDYQQHCVFIITACVEIPGIYEYREGMTVADLIAAAGGLASDQRNTNNPTLPLCISVYRMKRPIYPVGDLFHCVFQLNLDETNAAICEANFELQPGDDVTIGRYPCVP